MGILNMLVEHHKKNKIRSQNFELFKACIAAGALIAMADDDMVRREQAAFNTMLRAIDKLKIYQTTHGKELFQEFVEKIQKDPDGGRAEAMEAIAAVKENPDWAMTLLMISATMMEADGEIHENELEVIGQIGNMLGIDSSTVESLKIDIKDEIFRV